MVRIEQDRLPLSELPVEDPAETGIPPLGHAGHVARRSLLLGVEMQPEVRSLEDAEVELLVLDLVASEVLGIQG